MSSLKNTFAKLKSLKEVYNNSTLGKKGTFIEFKTGGMRGIMKDGFDGINEVTANILGTVLESMYSSIVIGYDHRIDSDKFAFIVSSIFRQKNKPVKVFKYCITPYLAWESLQYDIGCMITASHNPKEYNGFKIYKKGCQIVEPVDKEIQTAMKDFPYTNIYHSAFEYSWKQDLINSCSSIVYKKFFKSYKININNDVQKVLPVFSAIYGISSPFITEACEFFNLKMNLNSVQNTINSEFPNIPYPNPEYKQPWEMLVSEVGNLVVKKKSGSSKSNTYKCTKKKADSPANTLMLGCKEQIANEHNFFFMCDPDGDRFGMAEGNNTKLKVYNGNEISKLFLWYFLTNYQPSEIALVNTFLCDDFFKIISEALQIKYVQTKTGFKNVSKAVHALRKENYIVLAYEDTLGFLMGDSTERDGVKAAILMGYILQEKTPNEIFEYFKSYGYFNSYTKHIRMQDPNAEMDRLLQKLEFEHLYDGHFRYEDQFKIIIRLSGTEPVLKVYSFTKTTDEETLKLYVDEWINTHVTNQQI